MSKSAEYYIEYVGGYSRDADSEGVTINYPDGRRVLNKGGFLWFKTLRVPPMSVIEVPRQPLIEEPHEHIPEEPSDNEAETDPSQRDSEKSPREKNPKDS